MSVPIARVVMPAATDAEAPPEDPPGVSAGSQGLRVTPDNRLSVRPNMASSGVVVLPTMTAPAARNRSTQMSSRSGMCSRNSRLPHRAGRPATKILSFTDTGIPSSGPRRAPAAWRAVAAVAAANAPSRSTWVKAFSTGSNASSRRQRLFEQSQRRDLSRIQQRRQRGGIQLPGHAFVSHRTFAWRGLPAPWPPRYHARECNPREEMAMTRTYNVVDADGHILEPLTLWDDYIDPAFRERRPRFVIDDNGKERLTVEGKLLGNPRGIGSLGSVGVRQGEVKLDSLKYADGRKGGFDPHARIVDMDSDGIDAAFLYPSLGLFTGAVEAPDLAGAMCRAYNRWLADYCKPYPDRLFGVAMLPMQSVDLAMAEMRTRAKRLACAAAFCGRRSTIGWDRCPRRSIR